MNQDLPDITEPDENGSIPRHETCWRLAHADRAALLVDGAGYFGALRIALLGATRRIVIVGWDVDSRTPIRGEHPPDDDAPESLGSLLSWLVERKPQLRVHVLLWDYSLLYALEREPLPRLNLGWKTPERVEVCLDSKLPVGASHHEKMVVIDDRIAFCGGLDLTVRRWDRELHAPADPDRVDPGGEPYGAFHDLQMLVDGDAARSLAELALDRWNRAGGSDDRLLEISPDPWPDPVEPDFRDVDIGIARTRPRYGDETELRQVEAAYLRAIRRAERFIYIENQYLTAGRIASALARRLEAEPRLELVIVNPREPSGWLEERTMGQGRKRFVDRLDEARSSGRVRVLYPWVGAGDKRSPVMVHAKLMIVDDLSMQIGSANLNSRSMGVDRECDLVIEARNEREGAAIAAIRRRLLSHHLGTSPERVAAADRESGSLIASIESISDDGRGLSPIPAPAESDDESEWLAELADPEQPIEPEAFVGDLFGAVQRHPVRRHLFRLLGATALLGVALALWRYSPLSDWVDPDRLAGVLASVASSRWTGPLVIAAFVVLSFLVFPVTVLIAATAVALGPVDAFGWALAGTLLAAAVNFGVGRRLPEQALQQWFGSWVARVNSALRRGGIVSVMIVRNVPVAPFSVVNVLAGAARIPWRDFLLGTLLGMLPGIAALTLLGDRLRGVFQKPGWTNVGLLLLAIAIWIGIALGLQVLSNRLADER